MANGLTLFGCNNTVDTTEDAPTSNHKQNPWLMLAIIGVSACTIALMISDFRYRSNEHSVNGTTSDAKTKAAQITFALMSIFSLIWASYELSKNRRTAHADDTIDDVETAAPRPQ